MIIICPHCKKQAEVKTCYINRAKKLGVPRYCSKVCSGLARRIERSEEEKKKIKQEYDTQYRIENQARIKERKRLAFLKDYKANPDKYKKERQRRMAAHVEYCRKPEYKVKKKKYDHKYRLEQKYGDFWEAASALVSLNKEVDSKQAKYDQGIINKTQKRKRQWQQLQEQSLPRII
jgi:hypothetical protein